MLGFLLGSILVLAAAGDRKFHDPHCMPGRTAMVQLFEWRYDDVARECEAFLGPYGYCGAQVSPPSENAVWTSPFRPWWERYQPISYKINSRSGDQVAFADMVARCNKAGVRIYPNVVVNHMAGAGRRGQGTGGSGFDAGKLQFPAVPYGPTDFNGANNCHTSDGGIHNYNSPEEVRNCQLVGLSDLALGKDYVRGKVATFLNALIDLGVAGFRVDAAKHMWPADLANVVGRLKTLKSDVYGPNKSPFVVLEVIDLGGETIKGDEYLGSGRITNFKFGKELTKVFRRRNPMKYLANWGPGWGMWAGGDVVNFIDNHDNQRSATNEVLTSTEHRAYKLATIFMLAHPYGFPRVMSSYSFSNFDDGPPHSGDQIAHVTFNSDFTCQGGWVCEHRWREIFNMVAFRNMAGTAPLGNWWAGADYQIAFSRGDKAFVALNLEGRDLDATLQTGLGAGTYCDVISGGLAGGRCTGSRVDVGGDGRARVHVCGQCEDPALAIHVGAKVGSSSRRVGA